MTHRLKKSQGPTTLNEKTTFVCAFRLSKPETQKDFKGRKYFAKI